MYGVECQREGERKENEKYERGVCLFVGTKKEKRETR